MTDLAQDAKTFECRKAFAEELLALARRTSAIVAVCNDSSARATWSGSARSSPTGSSTSASPSRTSWRRAGLANGGLVPFVSAAAPFLPGALEQIKADAAYSNAHMILCGQSPGMAYGELARPTTGSRTSRGARAIANLRWSCRPTRPQTRAAVRWAAPGRPVLHSHPAPKVPAAPPRRCASRGRGLCG